MHAHYAAACLADGLPFCGPEAPLNTAEGKPERDRVTRSPRPRQLVYYFQPVDRCKHQQPRGQYMSALQIVNPPKSADMHGMLGLYVAMGVRLPGIRPLHLSRCKGLRVALLRFGATRRSYGAALRARSAKLCVGRPGSEVLFLRSMRNATPPERMSPDIAGYM